MTIPRRSTQIAEVAYMQVLDFAAIRRARQVKRWTQRELAAICGKTQTAVYRLEKGPKPGKVLTIKEPFALDLTRLLELDLDKVFGDIPESARSAAATHDTESEVSS